MSFEVSGVDSSTLNSSANMNSGSVSMSCDTDESEIIDVPNTNFVSNVRSDTSESPATNPQRFKDLAHIEEDDRDLKAALQLSTTSALDEVRRSRPSSSALVHVEDSTATTQNGSISTISPIQAQPAPTSNLSCRTSLPSTSFRPISSSHMTTAVENVSTSNKVTPSLSQTAAKDILLDDSQLKWKSQNDTNSNSGTKTPTLSRSNSRNGITSVDSKHLPSSDLYESRRAYLPSKQETKYDVLHEGHGASQRPQTRTEEMNNYGMFKSEIHRLTNTSEDLLHRLKKIEETFVAKISFLEENVKKQNHQIQDLQSENNRMKVEQREFHETIRQLQTQISRLHDKLTINNAPTLPNGNSVVKDKDEGLVRPSAIVQSSWSENSPSKFLKERSDVTNVQPLRNNSSIKEMETRSMYENQHSHYRDNASQNTIAMERQKGRSQALDDDTLKESKTFPKPSSGNHIKEQSFYFPRALDVSDTDTPRQEDHVNSSARTVSSSATSRESSGNYYREYLHPKYLVPSEDLRTEHRRDFYYSPEDSRFPLPGHGELENSHSRQSSTLDRKALAQQERDFYRGRSTASTTSFSKSRDFKEEPSSKIRLYHGRSASASSMNRNRRTSKEVCSDADVPLNEPHVKYVNTRESSVPLPYKNKEQMRHSSQKSKREQEAPSQSSHSNKSRESMQADTHQKGKPPKARPGLSSTGYSYPRGKEARSDHLLYPFDGSADDPETPANFPTSHHDISRSLYDSCERKSTRSVSGDNKRPSSQSGPSAHPGGSYSHVAPRNSSMNKGGSHANSTVNEDNRRVSTAPDKSQPPSVTNYEPYFQITREDRESCKRSPYKREWTPALETNKVGRHYTLSSDSEAVRYADSLLEKHLGLFRR